LRTAMVCFLEERSMTQKAFWIRQVLGIERWP
jgi:hypothetical protein